MDDVKNIVDFEYRASGAGVAAGAMQNLGKMATYAGAAIAASITALYTTAAKMASVGAEIYDTATRLNLSVETVQSLGYVAQQTGSDLQGLSGSIRALNTFMLQADTATSDQAKALDELGLQLSDLEAMSPEQMFLAITDALGGVQSEMRQNVLAASIFGNRYRTQVVGALNQTDGSLRTLMEDFAESGRAMSTDQIAALKKYDDAMTDVEYSIKALTADAIVPLLPKMQELADRAIAMARENMPAFIESAGALADALLLVAEAALKVANNFINLGENIGGGLAQAWNWVSGASRDLDMAEQMADEAAQRVLELQMAGELTGRGAAAGMSLLAQETQAVAEAATEASEAVADIGGGTVSGGGGGRSTSRSEEAAKTLATEKDILALNEQRFAIQQEQILAARAAREEEVALMERIAAKEAAAYQERMAPVLSIAQQTTDILVSGMTRGFDNIGDQFKNMLVQMAADWLKSTLFRTLFNVGKKGFFL